MNAHAAIEKGKEIIRIEAEAVAALESRINGSFASVVELIFNAKGRVILTGIGKSGIIARKIAATMSSTGTPSAFMHPSDALHGDLGMVTPDDVVIFISKSGDTGDLWQLLLSFHQLGVKIIAITGNTNSPLSKQCDIVLDVSVKEEACPYDLAPTSSTTAALVMGDALAITLLQKRNFTQEDFAMFHPGGNLGKRLLLKVEMMMTTGADVPIVKENVSLSDAIIEISSKRLGATCVVENSGVLCGILTDGDLRRLLQRTTNISNLTAGQVMTKNPKTIRQDILAVQALNVMESFKITQLVVVDDGQRPIGVLHLHDLVEAGLGGETGA
ncbi:MAG: KpsF/GutQ family sugar-phosphate isomerase [Ignavibacteriae bacterium]|nr:MAG: KpsF/GutQ family sugar-phosphate isomerase [Ignavibacteriota bacterium]